MVFIFLNPNLYTKSILFCSKSFKVMNKLLISFKVRSHVHLSTFKKKKKSFVGGWVKVKFSLQKNFRGWVGQSKKDFVLRFLINVDKCSWLLRSYLGRLPYKVLWIHSASVKLYKDFHFKYIENKANRTKIFCILPLTWQPIEKPRNHIRIYYVWHICKMT